MTTPASTSAIASGRKGMDALASPARRRSAASWLAILFFAGALVFGATAFALGDVFYLRLATEALIFGGLALSVDLIDGRWLGRPEPWAEWGITAESRVQDIIDSAMQTLGCWYLILLDLAQVGTGRGPHPYCETLVRQFRDLYAGGEGRELLVGGGIRGPEDVRRLANAGADGVLVASALHDGTLNRWPVI